MRTSGPVSVPAILRTVKIVERRTEASIEILGCGVLCGKWTWVGERLVEVGSSGILYRNCSF